MARLLKKLMSMDSQYLQVLLQRQMFLDRRRLQVIGIVIALSVGALILIRSGTDTRRDASDFDQADQVLTEDEALAIAFEEAQDLGLTEAPTVWLARQISFGEDSTLAGDRARAFAGTREVSPSAITWVISMNGNWSTPLLGDDVVDFDNVVVVLDAISGEPFQVASYFEDFESDVRLPGFFDRGEPCDENDLGVFERIFRSTCPWPAPDQVPQDETTPQDAAPEGA